MATASKRDVTLGVAIETTGVEGLQKLAQEVRRLGAEGGPAAAQFDVLADQIDRLGQQAGQVDRLRALTNEIGDLEQAQREAATTTEKVTQQLQEQATVVTTVRQRQQELRQDVDAARAALREAELAVRSYKDENNAAARKTKEYGETLKVLQSTVLEQGAAVDRARTALRNYGSEVAEAVNRESKLEAASRRAAEAQEAAARALTQRASALSASQQALLNAGAATADLAAADAELLERQQDLISQAQRLEQAQRESTQALQLQQQEANDAARAYALLVGSLKDAQSATAAYGQASAAAAAASGDSTDEATRRLTAARALVESDKMLTDQQRQLANSLTQSRAALVSNAQALVAQADAADRSQAATARLVRESISAGLTLETAFGTTGVRSLQAIENEALAVERAVSLLQRQFEKGAISAQDLARGVGAAEVKLQQLRAEASQIQSLPGAFERVNTTITGVINRFGALGAALATVSVAARPAVESIIALDQTVRILTTVTGSVESARTQIEFLRQTAQRSGQSFDELAGSYAKFAASALQTGLSIEDVQSTFESVAVAAGNLGLSSDQTKRALEALSQIASKGVAGMEELRQQLGDALPGVLPLLAKQLGLTTGELNKLVESGGLASREAIPAIRDALRQLGTQGTEDVKGLVAEWSRFKSGLSEATAIASEGALGAAIGILASGLQKVAGIAVVGAVGITELFTAAVRGAGAFAGTLAGGGGIGDALRAVAAESEAANGRLEKLAIRFGLVEDSAKKQASALDATATAAGAAGESLAKLQLRQGEALAAAELSTQVATKQAQALATAVQQAESAAKSYTNQAEGQKLVVQAQDAYVDAVERSAQADQRVVDTLRSSKDELLARISSTGAQTDAYKAQIQALDDKIAKAEAEATKTAASARAEEAKADALRATVLALQDNSAEYGKLLTAVQAAERKVAEITERAKEGKAGLNELEGASKTLRAVKLALRDAFDDLSKSMERQVRLLESENALQTASIKVQIERIKVEQAKAKLAGDDYRARLLAVDLQNLQIKLDESQVTLSRRKAEITLKEIQAERESAAATGTLTAAKRDELQARENVARASLIESDAAKVATEGKVIERQVLEQAAGTRNAMAGGIGQTTAAYDKDTIATGRNTGAQTENAQALRDRAKAAETLAGSLGKASTATTNLAKNQAEGRAAIDAARTGVRQPGGVDNQLSTRGGTDFSVLGKGGGATSFSTGFQYTPPDSPGQWVFDVDEFNRAGGWGAGFTDSMAKKFWKLTDESAAQLSAEAKARSRELAGQGGGAAGLSVFQSVRDRQTGAVPTSDPVAVQLDAQRAENTSAGLPVDLNASVQQLVQQLAASQATAARTVNINLSDGTAFSLAGSDSDIDSLIKLLERANLANGGGG